MRPALKGNESTNTIYITMNCIIALEMVCKHCFLPLDSLSFICLSVSLSVVVLQKCFFISILSIFFYPCVFLCLEHAHSLYLFFKFLFLSSKLMDIHNFLFLNNPSFQPIIAAEWSRPSVKNPRIKSPPWSYIAGLRRVCRHITVSTVLTQEEILKDG